MTTNIDKYDDIIDSRDVIARIEELQAERDALQEEVDETGDALDVALIEADGNDTDPSVVDAYQAHRDARVAVDEWDGAAELAILEALAAEGEGSPDWRYGETLIRDSYFRDYAQELAKDCGDVIWAELRWPLTCIDWAQAARELRMDYTPVDFDGVTYWIRS